MSRNVSLYLPFWVAIPTWLLAAAVWVVIGCVYVLVWLAVQLGKAISSLSRSSSQTTVGPQPSQHPALEARWQGRRNQAAAQRDAARPLVTVSRPPRGGHRASRERLGWPGWGNVAAVADSDTTSPLALTGGTLALAAAPVAAVSIPAGIYRSVRRRRAS